MTDQHTFTAPIETGDTYATLMPDGQGARWLPLRAVVHEQLGRPDAGRQVSVSIAGRA